MSKANGGTRGGKSEQMNPLRMYRKARGLTQEELGQQMGKKSKAAVSRWESGADCPRNIPKLAKVLGIDPIELAKFFELGPAAYSNQAMRNQDQRNPQPSM